MSIWVCPHLGIHAPTPHCPEASRGEFVKAEPAVPPQPTVESNWKLCPTCGVGIAGWHICPKGNGPVIAGVFTTSATAFASPPSDPVPSLAVPPTPKQCRQCRKWFVPNPAMRNVSCCVDHGGGCCHYSETEVPAPQPTSVEGLRQEFFKYGYVEQGVVDALIAAVRSSTLSEVKALLDAEFPDSPDTCISRDNFLAGLAKMEGP